MPGFRALAGHHGPTVAGAKYLSAPGESVRRVRNVPAVSVSTAACT